jgi:hypothetical protein
VCAARLQFVDPAQPQRTSPAGCTALLTLLNTSRPALVTGIEELGPTGLANVELRLALAYFFSDGLLLLILHDGHDRTCRPRLLVPPC